MFFKVLVVLAFCTTAYVLFISVSGSLQDNCAWIPFATLTTLCTQSKQPSWNLFYHLGGNGPWIPRASAGDESLPMNCIVDQAHMISRHGERYPTANAGRRHLALLDRLEKSKKHLTGSLEFLKEWKYFTNITGHTFEDLVRTGPYAGTTQSFDTGRKLRKRYTSLIDPNKSTKFWTCDAGRDIETARYFGSGFFGSKWEDGSAELVIIPETSERGGDTLTPGDTCLAYVNDDVEGHDRGYAELAAWQRVFTKPISERLGPEAGNIDFSPIEIYSMMEMCGFEILAKGKSPWCDVFSHEEWLDFEYGRDLLHFYRAGPGNKYAASMGMLWLNATTTLLANSGASGFYASFVHDGDIIPLLTAMGIFDGSRQTNFLPNTKRLDSRLWKTSDVVPMGGRLVFERVTCSKTGLGQNLRRSYIRLFINDGLVDLQRSLMGGGLAYAVGMNQWTDMVRQKNQEFGNFKKVCELPDSAPDHIQFLKPQYG